jgi:hypothetical protein
MTKLTLYSHKNIKNIRRISKTDFDMFNTKTFLKIPSAPKTHIKKPNLVTLPKIHDFSAHAHTNFTTGFTTKLLCVFAIHDNSSNTGNTKLKFFFI